jgi:hypothetical protein
MNTRPFLAALLLLACLVQVGLVNYWIMRLEVALSRTSRVEISNNTNTRLLPEIPAIIPSQQQALPTCESLMKSPNSPVCRWSLSYSRNHAQHLDPPSGWLSGVDSPIDLSPQTVYVVRSTSVLVEQTSSLHW